MEDPSLPAIDLAGSRFHTEAFGVPDAPLVMVLHGGPGADYRALRGLAALADDGMRVAFFDQRSTGLSARHDPETIDLDVYLEDLRLMIDHYTPSHQRVVFVAQSWGAMYATAFINTYGDYNGQIAGAILTDPGAFTDRQLDVFMGRLEGSMNLFGEQFNDALWAGQFISATDHASADYNASLLTLRAAPSEARDPNNLPPFWRAGAYVQARLFGLATQGFDWTTNLDAFPHAVLFLRGDLNTATPLEYQQELAGAYSHAEIETITNVGHEVIWERTDDYLTHARAYLRQVGVVQ